MHFCRPIFSRVAMICFLLFVDALVSFADDQAPSLRVITTNKLQTTRDLAEKITSPFHNPHVAQMLRGQNTFLLCLSKATFDSSLAHQLDPNVPIAFELLSYNHLPVGPTLRVHRGETFYVHLMNLLDPDPNVKYPPPLQVAESAHDLGSTNLHTHGLQVSPDGNSDNIFVSVDPLDPTKPIDPDKGPSNEHLFRYSVPDDHPAGTFWYHPHRHGSVAYQIANGLAGALIVEGDPHFNNGYRDLESIPEIAAASEHDPKDPKHNHERIAVLQMYDYTIGLDGKGRIDAQLLYNYYSPTDPKSSASITVTGTQAGRVVAINGVLNPVFTIAPGEVQRWRFIYSGHDVVSPLILADSTGKQTSEIEFHQIALDGIPTGTITAETEIDIAPGQRSDVLIRCPDTPKDTTYYLMQAPTPPGMTTRGKRLASFQYIAKIVVQGDKQNMQLPNCKDPAVRSRLAECQPFHPLDGKIGRPSIPNGKLNFFAEDPPQGQITPANYTINGKDFHSQNPVTIDVGHVEEWVLSTMNVPDGHPFHIHVNPFQVVSSKDTKTGAVTNYKNYWRDTLFVQARHEYTIRIYFRPEYVGDTVLHCHILDHEDQGMMMCLQLRDPSGNLKVVGPGCSAAQLAACNILAPPIHLPNGLGSVQDLKLQTGRATVLVFFRGMECPACVAQLRNLLAALHASVPHSADVVAISSEPIADPAAALKALASGGTDHVRLLVDKELKSFRDYGCTITSEPQHGLFVIDGNGVIRQRYSGPVPYRDMPALLTEIGKLSADTGVSASGGSEGTKN